MSTDIIKFDKMAIEPIEVVQLVNETIDELAKRIELEGKRLETGSNLLKIKGILTRGEAYKSVDMTTRTGAEYFNISKSTFSSYMQIFTHYTANKNAFTPQLIALEEPSMRNILKLISIPKEPKSKVSNSDGQKKEIRELQDELAEMERETVDSMIDYIKEAERVAGSQKKLIASIGISRQELSHLKKADETMKKVFDFLLEYGK